MKSTLVDTNILSLFFRNQPLVIENFNAYIQEYDKKSTLVLSPIMKWLAD
jgi:tRNA(fMet)-specific endonuclease VapC